MHEYGVDYIGGPQGLPKECQLERVARCRLLHIQPIPHQPRHIPQLPVQPMLNVRRRLRQRTIRQQTMAGHPLITHELRSPIEPRLNEPMGIPRRVAVR